MCVFVGGGTYISIPVQKLIVKNYKPKLRRLFCNKFRIIVNTHTSLNLQYEVLHLFIFLL